MDETGALQCKTARWEAEAEFAAAEDTELMAYGRMTGKPYFADDAAQGSYGLELAVSSNTQIPMVTGLEIGEETMPDPSRPSMILCRAGEESLWDMAKRCGSTVEAIREANGLQDIPEPERMLLIPIP